MSDIRTDREAIRCWQCGVQPLETHDVTRLGDHEPRYLPGRWPAGDHEHAVTPPTPAELVEAGRRAADRIVAELLDAVT